MKLSDCKKDDLIWIIKAMCRYELSDRSLQRALKDLEWEKEKAKFIRADELLETARAGAQRYFDLLKPYEGVPIGDVPMEVLKQADAALTESRAADAQWAKLMGVKRADKKAP